MTSNLFKVLVWFGLGIAITEAISEMLAVSGRARHDMNAEQATPEMPALTASVPPASRNRSRNLDVPTMRTDDGETMGSDR